MKHDPVKLQNSALGWVVIWTATALLVIVATWVAWWLLTDIGVLARTL